MISYWHQSERSAMEGSRMVLQIGGTGMSSKTALPLPKDSNHQRY